MNKYVKVLIVMSLLVLSHLYLLRPGFWFYQDAGYWPKNLYEVYLLITQQLQAFTNTGYYLGFDQGLFNYTRIVIVGIQAILFFIFGFAGSQIAYSLFGTVLTLISFYLFSGIYFTDKNTRFLLSLLYTFNPLLYSLQGATYFNAVIPLFLYTYYEYLYVQKKIRFSFLLFNIFAGFLWVSYIRFLESNFFVIAPYCLYFFISHKRRISYTRLGLFVFIYIVLFSPIFVSFIAQLLEHSQTAFNYGAILGKFVAKEYFFNAFNFFQSVGADLYKNVFWSAIGVAFFAGCIYLYYSYKPNRENYPFLFLNIIIVLFGILLFGLGNLFSSQTYFFILRFFPFLTNIPFWALYVVFFPFVIFFGLLSETRKNFRLIYIVTFLIIAVFPLLRLNDFQLQKFSLSQLPQPYYDAFVQPSHILPESTYYFLGTCWRAKYMNQANVPTMCPNWGLKYVSAVFGDPRLTAGNNYQLAKLFTETISVNNLRITQNLKHIIIPNDAVTKKGPGPITSDFDIAAINEAKKIFDSNKKLEKTGNDNFTLYTYTNKNDYDFFIYAPRQIIYEHTLDSLLTDQFDIRERPTILTDSKSVDESSIQQADVQYKLANNNDTKYYVYLSHIDSSRPLLLQFNQTFSPSWKLYFVTKQMYRNIHCTSEERGFPITHNAYCLYNEPLLNFSDVHFLTQQAVMEKNHLTGNYVSNAWVIPSEQLKRFVSDDELYAVIIFQKQILYTYAIICSVLSMCILITLTIWQELFIKKKW